MILGEGTFDVGLVSGGLGEDAEAVDCVAATVEEAVEAMTVDVEADVVGVDPLE